VRRFYLKVGDNPREDDTPFSLFRNALADAYSVARFENAPVTVFQADGEEDATVYKALAVVSALEPA
jgi:hypothetical protein